MRFLEGLADQLIKAHGKDLSDVTVILPTQRSRLFLVRYLFKIAGGNIWAPKFQIFPEFVAVLHGGRTGSELEMLLAFYDVYRIGSANPESFSTFIRWAPVALRDFRDIDASLADPRAVFSDLRNIREIEEWSFQAENLSESQKQYLVFWSELGSLYGSYASWQDENHSWTYQRMVRRLCEEGIDSDLHQSSAHVYVAGLSAFSPAEEKLLKLLQGSCNVHVLWDLDKYYVLDGMHEAGGNYRRSSFQISKDRIPANIGDHEMNVIVHESSTAVSQVLGAADVLKAFDQETLNDTCVVLSDESLSEAFLSALSDVKVPVNLALGLAAGRFIHARIVRSVLKIRLSRSKKSKGIYHNDLVGFLHLLAEAGIRGNDAAVLLKRLVDDVRVFADDKYLKRKSEDLTELRVALACLWSEEADIIPALISFIEGIPATDDVAQVAKVKVIEAMTDLSEMIGERNYLQDPESVLALYEHVIAKISVYYQGEPVNGLQVLNMVETRGLDFSTVLVLGANDDILPGNQFDQSFIPFDLRAYYKLVLPDVKDATYAHTFYRLLHHAKNLHLFYSSVSSDFKNVEPSRYIIQVQQELAVTFKNLHITRRSLRTVQNEAYKSVVQNSELIKKRILEIFAAGISPSAINKFVACPLDFYYRHILGLGEEEKVEERMTDATFGSAIHLVLEKFFQRFIDSYPKESDLMNLKNNVDSELDAAIDEIYSISNTESGENLLMKSLGRKMLLQFIDMEIRLLQEKSMNTQRNVIAVEKKLRREIDTARYGLTYPVVVSGKSDRIDQYGGMVEIVDYKSGKIDPKDLILKGDLGAMFTDTKSAKALQLMLYTYMFAKEVPVENIRSGIFSMVNYKEGYMFLEPFADNINGELMQHFESELVKWIDQLYNTKVFQHNHDSKFCEYCY